MLESRKEPTVSGKGLMGGYSIISSSSPYPIWIEDPSPRHGASMRTSREQVRRTQCKVASAGASPNFARGRPLNVRINGKHSLIKYITNSDGHRFSSQLQ